MFFHTPFPHKCFLGPCAGDQISSKQLRDDLMTMLVAGHETTAAVLTWTLYLLSQHPDITDRVREEVRTLNGGVRWGAGWGGRSAKIGC